MNNDLQILKTTAADISLLYVEDNKGLRKNIKNLLGKILPNILTAEDGQDGFKVFKAHRPKIVISDVNMPNMNGFEMAKKIRSLEPATKIILMTAYNEKEHLHQAIDLGIFRYLSKPAKVPELIAALSDAVIAIHAEENHSVFQNQLKDIFNYQNNVLIMMKDGMPILANQRFCDFFGVEDLDAYLKKHENLNDLLLEHREFLYSSPESNWYDIALQNSGKLYHTKMLNHSNEARHLIMKLRSIPEKEGCTILSFDDVTDLNLMALFDSKTAKNDKILQDQGTVIKMMTIVHENSAEIKVHNFYKGLTITNPAVLVKVDNESIILKTSISQLKAVQLVRLMTLSSEIFPADVFAKSIDAVDFENQTITFSRMQFLQRSGTDRQYIRLEPEPEPESRVTFFYNERKFFGDARIVDLSVVSIKIEINALPAGMKVEDEASVAMVLPSGGGQPLLINTPATIYRIDEETKDYRVVMLFELPATTTKKLVEYLSRRQMALIREFKALEFKP